MRSMFGRVPQPGGDPQRDARQILAGHGLTFWAFFCFFLFFFLLAPFRVHGAGGWQGRWGRFGALARLNGPKMAPDGFEMHSGGDGRVKEGIGNVKRGVWWCFENLPLAGGNIERVSGSSFTRCSNPLGNIRRTSGALIL